MKVLCVTASPSKEYSLSRRIAVELLAGLYACNPELTVTARDLGLNPPPHWGAPQIEAAFTPSANRTEAMRMALKQSDEFCAELQSADILVVATPMWNFSVPSTLKAWIDHVMRVGTTFRYDETGRPIGMLAAKCVYVIEATGGLYGDASTQALNHAAPYLEQLFGFLGAPSIVRFAAAGTAQNRDQAWVDAQQSVRRHFKARTAQKYHDNEARGGHES